MASGMLASRAMFAEDLWSYGEDDLALAMLLSDDDTYRRVMIAATAVLSWTRTRAHLGL